MNEQDENPLDHGEAGPEAGPKTGLRGERTRNQLLKIAIRRFAERGFRETSVSAIAREAGLSPAAVYAYFPDKHGLFIAAFDHDATALLDRVLPGSAPLSPDAAPVSGDFRMLPLAYAALPKHPLARRVLEGHEPDLVPRLFDLPSSRKLRTNLEQLITIGQQLGRARTDIDPSLIATGLETIFISLLMTAVQAGVTEDEERRQGVFALIRAATQPPGSD
jgi:TetR/AcrR family transcriptional regulator, transcriptional repressor of aconitase